MDSYFLKKCVHCSLDGFRCFASVHWFVCLFIFNVQAWAGGGEGGGEQWKVEEDEEEKERKWRWWGRAQPVHRTIVFERAPVHRSSKEAQERQSRHWRSRGAGSKAKRLEEEGRKVPRQGSQRSVCSSSWGVWIGARQTVEREAPQKKTTVQTETGRRVTCSDCLPYPPPSPSPSLRFFCFFFSLLHFSAHNLAPCFMLLLLTPSKSSFPLWSKNPWLVCDGLAWDTQSKG